MTIFTVSKATYYSAGGEGIVVNANNFKTAAEAAQFITDDYAEDREYISGDEWEELVVTEDQIKDGADFRSPADDPDHDTIWHVTIQEL